MKVDRRKEPRRPRAVEVAGIEQEETPPFFDLKRDVPREDLEGWKELLSRGHNGTSYNDKIKIYSAAKLVVLIPEHRDVFRAYPWIKEDWIKYFNEFFITSDYHSHREFETGRAYQVALDFLRVFPEARAELFAGRDVEADFQLLMDCIKDYQGFHVVPIMLQLWPDRRSQILNQADAQGTLVEAKEYGALWRLVPLALVQPHLKDELLGALFSKGLWRSELTMAKKRMLEKYYYIPRYYEIIQELGLLAADEASIGEDGEINIVNKRALLPRPNLPERPHL